MWALTLALAALQSATCERSPPRAIHVLPKAPRRPALPDAARAPLGSAQSETSSLSLRFPDGRKQSLPHTDALFGIPAYGGGTGGPLVYPSAEASFDGCAPLAAMYPGAILLLNRSAACTFAARVANAQRAGAVGVVVADSQGLCGGDDACPAGGAPAWAAPGATRRPAASARCR
jgi:hypothetical protein